MPRLTINIPYEVIETIMKKYPNLPPEEALRLFILDSLKGKASLPTQTKEVSEKAHISKEDLVRLQRSIQDILNPYSAKVDSLARRLSEVIEILETLSERLSSLEEEVKRLREVRAEVTPQPPTTYTRERARERGRRSAIEILKEQKIMFESDIAPKIKNRDAFFERLKRDGAIVLELLNERVAIDPNFWDEFKKKVKTLKTTNEAEIARLLGREGLALLKALSRSAQAYFDASKKSWILLIE